MDLDQANRYIFVIKVRNELIVQENDQSYKLFDKIREMESQKALRAFSLMNEAIENNERLCWSEMFYETYPLVSEYCSGCNAHETVEADEISRFPLLTNITGPEKEISSDTAAFFSGTNEALIITTDKLSDVLENYSPDVVVCDDEERLESTSNPENNIMNFAEFNDLQARDNGFYISGLIMAVYSADDELARKQYQIIYRALNKHKHIIHVSDRDFCVATSSGKKLSDLVCGTVIR